MGMLQHGGMGADLQHVVISASAGSGKTYQLVRRYVLLLAWGVEPERIAAMTFTKKASGEFFNRILNRLADLASGELKADAFFSGMTPLPPQWPDFGKLLRKTTEAMQRLRLGTMDSFFSSVTACFPLELGLPFGASVMAEDEAQAARVEVLSGQMERMYRQRDEAGMQVLLEGFKQATYGAEEKRSVDTFMDWVSAGHGVWLERPELERWGEPEQIWAQGEGARAADLNVASALERIRSVIDAQSKLSAKQAEKWEAILAAVEKMVPGQEIPDLVKDLLDRCEKVWTDLKRGEAEMTWQKKVVFKGEEAAALVGLCRCIVGRELAVRCRRTQGVAKMLAGYEKEYGSMVRDGGRLTFSDVTRLVGASADAWWQAGEGAGLWYRLDGRYDHWLFDEFQDTSFMQWRVVGELVDEVLQGAGEGRSFFAVGDPKQSIYLWRQAEPKLFRQVASMRDESGATLMKQEQLLVSYRSSAAVLEAVNKVCVSDTHLAELLPGASKLWSCDEHRAGVQINGCARLLWPVKREQDETTPTPEDVAVELLNELRPLERGLSCAVLVRQNKKGRELAERIRRETHMEVVCESEQEPAIDNPVSLAVLSLFQLAAHPGDRQALEHLRMTPLWTHIESGEQKRFTTCRELLRRMVTEGFAPLVHEWVAVAKEVAGDAWDAFSELRGKQLGDMAAEFDETGSRDVDAFLEFARNRKLRVRGGHQAVQVMTVHASKGLEFDMVLLPELSGDGMKRLRPRPLVVRRDDEGTVQWVLQEPPRTVCDLDEVMSEQFAEAEDRQEFETMCRLYVAMTRAKRGLYLITKAPPKSEGTMNEARLLRERLGDEINEEDLGALRVNVGWSTGDVRWYEACNEPVSEAKEAAAAPPLGDLLRSRQPMTARVTPSGEEDFRMKGELLFSTGREKGRHLGTLVHEMLATLEWDTRMDWQRFATRDHFSDAQVMLQRALSAKAVAAVFEKPSGSGVKLWRERPFDVLLDSHGWVSGTFDRVVIEPDKSSARIIDFKTDNLGENDEGLQDRLKGYAPQLELYREAVKRLAGVAEVTCVLVFLRSGRVVEV